MREAMISENRNESYVSLSLKDDLLLLIQDNSVCNLQNNK